MCAAVIRAAGAGAAILAVTAVGYAQAPQDDGGKSLPMGTTKGQKVNRLVLRNATVINGRGAPNSNRAMPPEGPVDIIIEGNRIVDVVLQDGVNTCGGKCGKTSTGDLVLDMTGMYVIPGLMDLHTHLPSNGGNLGDRAREYVYRIYMGHGVTTVRDAGSGAGLKELAVERRQSAASEIVAPRLVLCERWTQPLKRWDIGNNPAAARLMVRQFKEWGADCIKISKSPGQYPDVMAAAVDEGKKLGMPTMVDLKVSESDAVTSSNAGVASVEHYYGFPDYALKGSQSFPPDYNYWDERYRFRYSGKLWDEAERTNPEKIAEGLDILIKNGTAWNPTMVAYEDNRDLFRGRTLPFRETLMHPAETDPLPNAAQHGSYHHDWTVADEINWKRHYQVWFKYLKMFHEKGGLLSSGSDIGDIGGIMLIRELELMQEAGIHPLDVIRVATTNSAKVLGWGDTFCGIRVGCVADLAVVNGNPIANFKVMYGRGYAYYGILPKSERWKHGGVKYTIKDGVVYDAQALLREAEWYVEQERQRLRRGTPQVASPGAPQ